ncbi:MULTISPECIES: porin [unclassified Methylibium]|uniref:porin n=1 Tax=unclassified Methylibium TaxID=2633235 RepID=UPI0003F42F0A|nr:MULTISPECIES: porin [unclassified Methylibium]EWS54442.1 Outer membrane porin protein 32 precursor [Methylibium sp. T29]EWS59401.1 Outer membrane porin protein 32 precursor [Methylibium sp. T29-B]
MTKKTMAHTLVKRSLIAGAVLATAGVASAQTVTIFGRIDSGFQYTSKVAGSGDSLSELHNGGILPSIWGFKGSEDLGGGLKAVFNLESDFDSGTGGSRFGGGTTINGIFGRQANVGLSGGWGTVLAGRQYSPALIAELGTEPRGYKESLSGLLSYAAVQLPAGNDLGGNNFGGIFTSNSISYSGAFGPVSLGVLYGFGEQAGAFSEGRTISLGVSYSGPVVLSGSYQAIRGIGAGTQAETKRYGVGVAVPLGDITIKALYHRGTQDDAVGDEVGKTNNFGIGADFRWNPQNTATVAYYYGKEKVAADDNTKTLVLSNDYALSKRTTLYGQFAYVDASANASIRTQVTLGATEAGEKSSIVGFGIKHDF